MASVELNDVEPRIVGSGTSQMRMRNSPERQTQEEEQRSGLMQEIVQEQYTESERKWAFGVFLLSTFDLVASAIIFCTAFKYAYLDNGVSLYCLGMQGFSHWVSSILLLSRFSSELFCGPKGRRAPGPDGSCLLREQRRTQLFREQGLSVFMGLVMLVSCASLMFKAFRKLKFWTKWYLDHAAMDHEAEQVTEWLCWVGVGIYSVQAVLRLLAARKLKTCIVSHACSASIISLLFLFVMGFASSYEKEWSWKAEPICAIVLAFVSLFEGVRIVYYYLDDMDTRIRRNPKA